MTSSCVNLTVPPDMSTRRVTHIHQSLRALHPKRLQWHPGTPILPVPRKHPRPNAPIPPEDALSLRDTGWLDAESAKSSGCVCWVRTCTRVSRSR